MKTLLQKVSFWLGGRSLASRALEILGKHNLMPSRIFRDPDEDGTVNLYFFKPMADAYALLVISEIDGNYLVFIQNGHVPANVIVLKDEIELDNWVAQVSNWVTYNSPSPR